MFRFPLVLAKHISDIAIVIYNNIKNTPSRLPILKNIQNKRNWFRYGGKLAFLHVKLYSFYNKRNFLLNLENATINYTQFNK